MFINSRSYTLIGESLENVSGAVNDFCNKNDCNLVSQQVLLNEDKVYIFFVVSEKVKLPKLPSF